MSRSRRWGSPVLTVVIVVQVMALTTRHDAAAADPSAKQLLGQLVQARSELEWPGTNLAEAARALASADEAFRFVKDGVAYVSYRGSYGGAAGTLRTRTGNCTDQSLLLAALLRELGYDVRLARGPWPKNAAPHRLSDRTRKRPALQKLSSTYQSSATGKNRTHRPSAGDRMQSARQEVEASLDVIERLIEKQGLASKFYDDEKIQQMHLNFPDRDWVWVQARRNGEDWADFDPVFASQPRPSKTKHDFKPSPVTLTVRLVHHDDKQAAKEILQWSGPISEVLGFDMSLTFLPADAKLKSLREVNDASKITEWAPLLRLGTTKIEGEKFAPRRAAKAAPKPPAGGNLFGGGLFGGGGSKPQAPPAATGGKLVLKFDLKGRDSKSWRWSRHFSRVMHSFTPGFDNHRLISMHRIGISVAAVPTEVAQARVLDELIDLVRMRQLLDGGKSLAEFSYQRGISSQTARAINTLLATTIGLSGENVEVGWIGPTVFIDSMQLAKEKQGLFCDRRFDLLAHTFLPSRGATRRDHLAWGLAICAAEAQLLNSTSVNHKLLKSARSLRVTVKDDLKEKPDRENPDIRLAVLGSNGVVIHVDKAASASWGIYRTGDLLGVLSDTDLRRQAKGGFSRSRAAGIGYGALGGGALASMGAPSALLVGGLVYYHIKLAEAYNKAATTLDFLGNAIETGDTSALTNNARQNDADFREFAQSWARNLGEGGASDYAGSLAEAGASPIPRDAGSLGAAGRRLANAGPATALSAGSGLPAIPAGLISGVLDYFTGSNK